MNKLKKMFEKIDKFSSFPSTNFFFICQKGGKKVLQKQRFDLLQLTKTQSGNVILR